MTRVVIIGHESAGFTAACSARAVDKRADIIVVERRSYPLYHPCAIPAAIGGEIQDIKKLLDETKPPNVCLKLETEAKSIDPDARTVEVLELKSGKIEKIPYDSLVIATGSRPFRPPIEGIDLKGVHFVRTIEDGEAIIKATKMAKRAVVIGGGTIGVETSMALRRRGLDTTLIEMAQHVLPAMLDEDMAELVERRLQTAGVKVVCGQRPSEIRETGDARSVLVDGKEYPAELVVVAAGAEPETELARRAGIGIGPTGGIKVDPHLQTSVPGVFAAGDCAETRDMITGEPVTSRLATTAIRMGKVAGKNAVGGRTTFNGTFNAAVTSVRELTIASTGITTQAAKKTHMDVISARIRMSNKPRYYPGAEPIYVKLLVEAKEHKLIGGQLIGTKGVAERANLLTLAIHKGVHVEELADLEHCYMPAVSDAIEPLAAAAEAVLRRL